MKYSLTLLGLAAVASAEWTSIFNITATPDQVIAAGNVPAPGQPGAKGQFNYAIDSKNEVICFDITLEGVTGDYQSPARTATHIHEAAKGKAGPPRIAFPNPGPITDGVRKSSGCLTGPFTTGIKAADNITDTGAGFKLAQIEANPAGFFTDSHTKLFVAGVVRGQLDQSFKIIDKDDGGVITTATLTKTDTITVSTCPPATVDCPYKTKPVVTVTTSVYTTICPVSELPGYTKPATKPAPVTTYPAPTVPVETKPYPTTTHAAATTVVSKPAVGTGSQTTATRSPEFTGAARANKVGGALMAVGLAAVLL